MNLDLTQRPQLTQHMSPQMFLLLKLLVQPRLELCADITAALLENPALEEDQTPEADFEVESELATVPTAPGDRDDDDEAADALRLLDHLDGGAGRDLARVAREPEVGDLDVGTLDRVASRSVGLAEHLLGQLREETDDENTRSIGEWIVRSLDADGYLREELSAIAAGLAVSPEEVESVLRRIQTLDPVGCGARDVTECLLIQARHRFSDRPDLARLIESHLPALAERRYGAIARATGITIDAVREESQRLRALNPKPGCGFGEEAPIYIEPDVHIFKAAGELIVRLNDDGLPRLRVSPYYRRLIRDARGARSEAAAFARANVAAAKWFIRSIYERQRTILRVTEAIVARQRDYFERGRGLLRPMLLRDVAGDVGMSESTVSRVTSRKYADTPQGLVELKSLFSPGIPRVNGAEVTPEAVQAMIRSIVRVEHPARPLSDEQILSRLRSDHGVAIARRTVAKYRDVLGIAGSSRRRQWTKEEEDKA
jgi:RNA polymerase sigma-54 factor